MPAAVCTHVEDFLGPIERVMRGFQSDRVDVDLVWVAPGVGRDFHTLVTCGMSGRPMTKSGTRVKCRCSPYAELLLRLPADWPVGPDAMNDPQASWPLRELLNLASAPHFEAMHFGHGHTMTVVDDTRSEVTTICPETDFCGWVLREPAWAPRRFRSLRHDRRHRLDFFGSIPLYAEELEIACTRGSSFLFGNLDRAGVTDQLVVDRPNLFAGIH